MPDDPYLVYREAIRTYTGQEILDMYNDFDASRPRGLLPVSMRNNPERHLPADHALKQAQAQSKGFAAEKQRQVAGASPALKEKIAKQIAEGDGTAPSSVFQSEKTKQVIEAMMETYAAIKKIVPTLAPLGNELLELGLYLQRALLSQGERAQWIQGPLKKTDTAFIKTVLRVDEKDKFDVVNNKDLVRGTLVCEKNAGLEKCQAILRDMSSVERYGMKITKDLNVEKDEYSRKFISKFGLRERASYADELDEGYSGYNYNVAFKGFPLVAEVQANTIAMMYGKMSRKTLIEKNVLEAAEYESLEKKMGFRGNMGHALYEISRGKTTKASEQAVMDEAKALSRQYNDACRIMGRYADSRNLQVAATIHHSMNPALSRFRQQLVKLGNREFLHIWDHAWEESIGTRH